MDSLTLVDGCVAEHSPGSNAACDTAPADTFDWKRHRAEMRRAMAAGECFKVPDGWCATHSGGVYGPVYCEPQ